MEDLANLVRRYIACAGQGGIVSAAFFGLPTFVVGPRGTHALQSTEEIAELFDMLHAVPGLAYSTCEHVSVKPLKADVVLCRAVTAWRRSDGSEIERVAATYLLRKTESWKIYALIATDMDKILLDAS